MNKTLETALLASVTPALLVGYHVTKYEPILWIIGSLLAFSNAVLLASFMAMFILVRVAKPLLGTSERQKLTREVLIRHSAARFIQAISLAYMLYGELYWLAGMMVSAILLSMIFMSMSTKLSQASATIKRMQS